MCRINDGNPVYLGCRAEDGALRLTHDEAPLGVSVLEVQLTKMEETTVTITDFDHDGKRYQVHAYTTRDGSRTPWERIGEGVRSPVLRALAGMTIEHDVTVEATSYAVSGEDGGSQPWYTPAAVKVRLPPPEDSRPDPPGD